LENVVRVIIVRFPAIHRSLSPEAEALKSRHYGANVRGSNVRDQSIRETDIGCIPLVDRRRAAVTTVDFSQELPSNIDIPLGGAR
jgi:hypothetical protein